VIEVFRQVHAAVPSRLLMVGDGPDLPDAAAQVRAAGLSDAVRFLGDQEQVVQLLSASDLFLMPSAQESFGLAALEAMACEVPVVASRVGGVPELVADGVTGFLFPPDDLESMANASIRLLTDAALHSRMAAAARQRAAERFADRKIIPMYEGFYDDVLTGRAG
jgi:N-acetyl-alpha-D-glucosaminyl L-malate synthase BshA